MNRLGSGLAALTTIIAITGPAMAAPVTYSFSTGATAFGGPVTPGGSFVSPSLFTGGASGTFVYDSAALLAGTELSGAFTYRGFTPSSDTGFVTSLSNLSGTVAGRAFSDVSGLTVVGNDAFLSPPGAVIDHVLFVFDPSLSSTSPHNFSGFEIDGFTLYRVRMAWAEGPSTPALLPDFLSNQDLPAAPPSFTGRFLMDFYQTSNPAATSVVILDGLQVAAIPEPETYAMLLAGLAVLAFATRRRKQGEVRSSSGNRSRSRARPGARGPCRAWRNPAWVP